MICPSILSYDFSIIKDLFPKLKESGIKVVHFDVMDNHFVPNLTFGYKFIDDLRKYTDLFFDTHLMIEKPEDSIYLYSNSSDLITVHVEAIRDKYKLFKEVEKLKMKGKKFGLSIKPKTEPDAIREYVNLIDLVLIMSVEPGFGGQELIRECLNKVKTVREISERNIIIQMDGGINKSNFFDVCKSGVDWFVIGSAFFKESDLGFYNKLLEDIRNDKYSR